MRHNKQYFDWADRFWSWQKSLILIGLWGEQLVRHTRHDPTTMSKVFFVFHRCKQGYFDSLPPRSGPSGYCRFKPIQNKIKNVWLYRSLQEVISLSQIKNSKQKLIERSSFYSTGVAITRHYCQHSYTRIMPCLSFYMLKTKCHTGALL